MMGFRTSLLTSCVVAANLGLAGAAAAATDGNASLFLQFSGLKWSSTDSDVTDSAGTKTSSTTDGLSTLALGDALVWVTIDKVNLYFNPFGGAKVLNVGYMFTEALEIGLDLGINTSKNDKSKAESTDNLYGIFGTWYQPAGPGTLEASLFIDMINQETKTPGPSGVATAKADGTQIKAQAVYLYPLAKNAWYEGALAYTMRNLEGDGEEKDEASVIDVTLAGIRVEL